MELETLFNNIAAAIHEKDGLSDGMTALQFPARIRNIPTQSNIEIESISVSTPPLKTAYVVGESFNPDGLEVKANFSNNESLIIDVNDLTFEPNTSLEATDHFITVSFIWNNATFSTTQNIIVNSYPIYGAKWDGTSTSKWARTDNARDFEEAEPYYIGSTTYSSPFDEIMPWAGMIKEERSQGTMVAIPKFYYSLSKNEDNKGLYIRISNYPLEGFHVSPAHMDRGDGKGERDIVYIARYLCDNNYKSITNQTALTNISYNDIRNALKSRPVGIYQYDYTLRFTIWLLYLVEMCDWNSQSKIGMGNNSTSGHTDEMPYHTGTMSSSYTKYGNGSQYRNIEGLWDNIGCYLDGANFSLEGVNITLNPLHFNDNQYIDVTYNPNYSYPSDFEINNELYPFFYASVGGGSTSTYTCDEWSGANADNNILQVGNRGSSSMESCYGLFFNTFDTVDLTVNFIGARIMELP